MEEQRDRFCQMAFQPWVWVLALTVFALSIWAILASGDKVGEDMLELQRQVQNSQTSSSGAAAVAAAQTVAIQQPLTPLPPNARNFIKAPHGERGMCHSCHPYSTQAPTSVAANQAQVAAAQQALTPLPIGARRFITPPHGESGRCHNCHPYTSTTSVSATAAAANIQAPTVYAQPTPLTSNFTPYPAAASPLGIVPGPAVKVRTSRFLFPCWRRGVLVRQVYPSSFAQVYGVQNGDAIIRFNGKKIRDTEHFLMLQSTLIPGTSVSLVVCRDGKQIRITGIN